MRHPNTLIKMVSKVSTIIDIMCDNDVIRGLFSQVDVLLRLYLTIPLSNATAERSFSALRRLKTYLRSSMSQQRLNHLMILHVHPEA